ncbi:MAG: PAS domain-containing protein [Cytophagales bacterium]|nr:PAS domain-containing protein [Cytophagales bacterium]
MFDYQQLVETAADAIIVCDAAGAITLWNAASTRMFGYSASEALGQSLDIIIPKRQQARHWDGYHQTMASGMTKYGASVLRVPAVHQDGHTLSIAFSVALMHDNAGKVNAIVALVRDESAKFAEERALKARVAELEMQLKA